MPSEVIRVRGEIFPVVKLSSIAADSKIKEVTAMSRTQLKVEKCSMPVGSIDRSNSRVKRAKSENPKHPTGTKSRTSPAGETSTSKKVAPGPVAPADPSSVRTRPVHKQVRIRVGKRQAEVDEGMAPLIRQLWKADIGTFMSCESTFEGRCWISFETEIDLLSFVEIAADAGFRSRIQPPACEDCMSADDWWVEGHFGDLNEGEVTPAGRPKRAWYFFSYNVYFPGQDLATVLKAFQRHNGGE